MSSGCRGIDLLNYQNENLKCVQIDTYCAYASCYDSNGQHCYGADPADNSQPGYSIQAWDYTCNNNGYCPWIWDQYVHGNGAGYNTRRKYRIVDHNVS
jgi:hypothetical protein